MGPSKPLVWTRGANNLVGLEVQMSSNLLCNWRGPSSVFGGICAIVGAVAVNAGTPCASWKQRFPANSPSARSNYSLAYDSVRNETLLWGGAGVPAHND